MQGLRQFQLLCAVIALLTLAGCADRGNAVTSSSTPEPTDAKTVEPVESSDTNAENPQANPECEECKLMFSDPNLPDVPVTAPEAAKAAASPTSASKDAKSASESAIAPRSAVAETRE